MLSFNPELITNGEVAGRSLTQHRAQAAYMAATRKHFDLANAALVDLNRPVVSAELGVDLTNAPARIPQDVYTEFDNQTTALVRANNLTLMNDLMGFARALPVGKVQFEHRRVSDSGQVTSSIGGAVVDTLDKANYDYDTAIKVIHQSGFGREWMEMEGQRSENFDALVDDQANSVRAVMDKIVDHFYDGATDEQGNLLSFKGTSATGIKNSSKTIRVNLASGSNNIGVDFTSASTTPTAMRNGFKTLRDRIRITNNIMAPLTTYVSAEIETNMERYHGVDSGDNGKTILQTVRELAGIADVKVDRKLSGNQIVMLPLDPQFIKPLIGMAINTVPIVRTKPFEDYNFMTWVNIGLDQRADYAGATAVLYGANG